MALIDTSTYAAPIDAVWAMVLELTAGWRGLRVEFEQHRLRCRSAGSWLHPSQPVEIAMRADQADQTVVIVRVGLRTSTEERPRQQEVMGNIVFPLDAHFSLVRRYLDQNFDGRGLRRFSDALASSCSWARGLWVRSRSQCVA